MPDHVHLFNGGIGGQFKSSAICEGRLRQVTGFEFERRELGQRLWQRYYYDHVLRPKDDPNSVAWVHLG